MKFIRIKSKPIVLLWVIIFSLFAVAAFTATVRDMARQRAYSSGTNPAQSGTAAQPSAAQPGTSPDTSSLYRTRTSPAQGAYRNRRYSGASAQEMAERIRRNRNYRTQRTVPSASSGSILQKYKVVIAPVGAAELETLLNQAAARGYMLVTTIGSRLIFVRS